MTLRHLTEYAVEILNLISVLLIWLPANRLSRQLLLVSRLEKIVAGDTRSVRELAYILKETVERALPKFSAFDYRCLYSGFVAAVLASIAKLILMFSAP